MNHLKKPPMKMKNPAYLAFGCSLVLLVSGVVHSHNGATGIVKQRMDAMGDMGDRSAEVADMFKGKTAFDKQLIAAAADSFIEHGMEMPGLFPDNKMSRTGSQTEALPAIWSRWEEFTELADDLVTRSESLQALVETTDEPRTLKRAFFRTTKSCSGCHKQFRKPKD